MNEEDLRIDFQFPRIHDRKYFARAIKQLKRSLLNLSIRILNGQKEVIFKVNDSSNCHLQALLQDCCSFWNLGNTHSWVFKDESGQLLANGTIYEIFYNDFLKCEIPTIYLTPSSYKPHHQGSVSDLDIQHSSRDSLQVTPQNHSRAATSEMIPTLDLSTAYLKPKTTVTFRQENQLSSARHNEATSSIQPQFDFKPIIERPDIPHHRAGRSVTGTPTAKTSVSRQINSTASKPRFGSTDPRSRQEMSVQDPFPAYANIAVNNIPRGGRTESFDQDSSTDYLARRNAEIVNQVAAVTDRSDQRSGQQEVRTSITSMTPSKEFSDKYLQTRMSDKENDPILTSAYQDLKADLQRLEAYKSNQLGAVVTNVTQGVNGSFGNITTLRSLPTQSGGQGTATDVINTEDANEIQTFLNVFGENRAQNGVSESVTGNMRSGHAQHVGAVSLTGQHNTSFSTNLSQGQGQGQGFNFQPSTNVPQNFKFQDMMSDLVSNLETSKQKKVPLGTRTDNPITNKRSQSVSLNLIPLKSQDATSYRRTDVSEGLHTYGSQHSSATNLSFQRQNEALTLNDISDGTSQQQRVSYRPLH